MTFASVLTLAALLADVVSGFEYVPILGFGPSISHNEAAFIAADRNPNATHSVNFTWAGATLPTDWIWRVNVTDVPVSDATGPSVPANPHIVTTVWDLQWPGSGLLNTTIGTPSAEASDPACIFIVMADLPQSVVDAWSPSDGANCSNALGAQCVTSALAGLHSPGAGRCPSFPNLHSLAGCEDSFGSGKGLTAFSSELISNFTVGNSTVPVAQGDGLFYSFSGAQAGTNTTLFDQAESALQILMLTGPSSQLLCQRVDSSSSSSAGVNAVVNLWTLSLAAFAVVCGLYI